MKNKNSTYLPNIFLLICNKFDVLFVPGEIQIRSFLVQLPVNKYKVQIASSVKISYQK